MAYHRKTTSARRWDDAESSGDWISRRLKSLFELEPVPEHFLQLLKRLGERRDTRD